MNEWASLLSGLIDANQVLQFAFRLRYIIASHKLDGIKGFRLNLRDRAGVNCAKCLIIKQVLTFSLYVIASINSCFFTSLGSPTTQLGFCFLFPRNHKV